MPIHRVLTDKELSRREFVRTSGLLGLMVYGGGVLVGCKQESDKPFDAIVENDIMIDMRDGVRLATDVYFPAKGDRRVDRAFPVILERTPYGKHLPVVSEVTAADTKTYKNRVEVAEFFVREGYIVVYQDCRGRYNSEGEYVKYLSDPNDGFDTCEWILKQPWCNGKIGTMGLSYAAHNQASLASAGAPGVVAMWLDSGGFSNSYQGGIRQGGAFELKQVTWAIRNGPKDPEALKDPVIQETYKNMDVHSWFSKMPWQPGNSPLTAVPEYEDYVFEQWRHGDFDDYWKQPGIYAQGYYDKFPNAAQVHMSGWYDPYPRTAIDNYLGMKKLGKGPLKLIIGPWMHGRRSFTHAGDVDFGAQATLDTNLSPDYLTARLRWFDQWMKGNNNGTKEEPEVAVFVMGGGSGRKNAEGRLDHGGKWRFAKQWPIPEAQELKLYLGSEGGLRSELAAVGKPLSFTYDPDHPVPSIGGNITSGAPIMEGGAFDQVESERFFGSESEGRRLSDRSDVLSFQTEPLEQDMEITGHILANLWVSSNCVDTDFTMKLVDVYPPSEDYPNGFAMNITDGILRCRYRDSWERPTLMTPGEVYPITIEPFPSSNLFKKGHSVRLDISSSNFPHFDLNFNTGEPEGMATAKKVATNTVYMTREQPSHIVLPVIPFGD
ncbi:CocE/NonD family hydrolase [uncultured Imperialibacter sp.]|uniref:CocE/NonD family hydrolase n=1 Tax=uncultured Imperialibacter sp. TaxID=1672639 RepID=UPI0030DC9A16